MFRILESVSGVKCGDQIGGRTILGWAFNTGHRDRTNLWAFVVQCQCGQIRVVKASELKRGKSRRCGSCSATIRAIKHGKCETKLYFIWRGMRSRCNAPSDKRYKNYGARGISVCSEWESFEVFQAWALSSGYQEWLEIDRENNDGNYCPDNCRWITHKEQCRNMRKNVWLEVNGRRMILAEFVSTYGLSKATVQSRLKKGFTPDQILAMKAG